MSAARIRRRFEEFINLVMQQGGDLDLEFLRFLVLPYLSENQEMTNRPNGPNSKLTSIFTSINVLSTRLVLLTLVHTLFT